MMIAIRGKSAIALCTVGILMAVCISAPTASAGGSGDPIIADLNGDGVEDMAVLTEVVPTGRVTAQSVRQCQIVLRPGQPDGEFGPAETHPYLALPADSYCPDMGTHTNV